MRSIDFLKFFTKNVVNRCLKHFQKITICLTNRENNSSYLLSSHLESNEKELEFIRKLSEFLITILLAKSYSKTKPIRHLLREILSVQVLNGINLICDPIYLNQKLLDYLKWHKISLERHKQIYAYSETYEQFIQLINKCCDIEDLKQIRFQIITEIMEATVINNLKKERGIDLNEKMFSGPITTAKGDLLQARNLKRYINQLTFAKNQCEKRINAINGVTSGQLLPQTDSHIRSNALPQPNRKTVLGFRVIMDSDICRSYLKKFMQYSLISSSSTPEIRRHLIVFWESIEQMSRQDMSRQYEMANEIINHKNFKQNFIKQINLTKNTLKAMEEFVLGNRGSEGFTIAQNIVYEILEHRYYPLFIVSQEYEQMLDQIQDTLENSNESTAQEINCESDVSESDSMDSREQSLVNINDNSIVEIHVSQTKQRLENLSQKLNDKRNALKALKKSETENMSKSQINVNLKLIGMLEKEIDDIQREYNQFEAHLECTEMWISGMGKWSADVHNIELDHIDGYYLAIIIVHRSDISETSSNGWIVARSFQQFSDLRRKLIKIYPNIKRLELPKAHRKSIVNDSQLKAIKQKLQIFLNFMTNNEKIYRSEELFQFLSQSADSLKQSLNKMANPYPSKPKMFSFAKLFGISQTIESNHSVETNKEVVESDRKSLDIDNQFLILNGLEDEDNIKDDIAEPLYDLISEIFELRTVSKWLRRSLMTFVQMTFGQTINKQLRSTVEWLSSESMIHYFISSFRESIWPNGTLSEPWPQSSDEERKRVQILAKQHLLNSIPEVFNNLLGQQNVRKGIVKVFDGLQNQLLNKQLFYVRNHLKNIKQNLIFFLFQELVETFMFEFVPELKSY